MFENNTPKIPLSDYIKWLALVNSREWSWLNNSVCKYVKVVVDTRSDYVVVLDRNGKPLTKLELFYQYGMKE